MHLRDKIEIIEEDTLQRYAAAGVECPPIPFTRDELGQLYLRLGDLADFHRWANSPYMARLYQGLSDGFETLRANLDRQALFDIVTDDTGGVSR